MPVSLNVRVICVFVFVRSAFASLYDSTPLSYYVLLITGSNAKVGWVQGVKGLVNLCSAFPFAILGDKYSRQLALRVSALVGVVSIVLTLFVLLYVEKWVPRSLFWSLCGVQALWGVFMGGHGATVEALFGDSVESGRRSKLYSDKAAARTAGNAVGPLLSIAIFVALTDEFNVFNLTAVMCAGMAAAVVCVVLLFLMRDKYSLGQLSESLLVVPAEETRDRAESAAALPEGDGSKDGYSTKVASETSSGGESLSPWCRPVRLDDIPALVALSDLLSALGSGMTVKFFSLWFGESLGISPVGVMLIGASGPAGITVATLLAGKLARRIGRVQATLFCKSCGVSLLVALALVDGTGNAALVGMYLVRTWLMNSTVGLTKSVLNDFVAKRHRAKWNAVESINMFSWSGSAVLGGYLVDWHGYRTTFLMTALLQACAAAMLIPLLFLVPVESFGTKKAAEPKVSAGTRDDTTTSPLWYAPVPVGGQPQQGWSTSKAEAAMEPSHNRGLDDSGTFRPTVAVA